VGFVHAGALCTKYASARAGQLSFSVKRFHEVCFSGGEVAVVQREGTWCTLKIDHTSRVIRVTLQRADQP